MSAASAGKAEVISFDRPSRSEQFTKLATFLLTAENKGIMYSLSVFRDAQSAAKFSPTTAIAKKNIAVVNPASGSRYHVTFDEALHLTQTKQAKWEEKGRIILAPDRNISAPWAPRQSGYAGPLVLQMIT